MHGTVVAHRMRPPALTLHGSLGCHRSCRRSPTARGASWQTVSGAQVVVLHMIARVTAVHLCAPIPVRLMHHSALRSGQPALTPPELSRLVCGYALLGDSSGEVAALLDAVAGTVIRRIKVIC